MDLIMERRGTRAWGTSRLGQGEQEDWSKGKRGTGLWEKADWGQGSSRTEPGRAGRLCKGGQEDWALGSRDWAAEAGTGPVGAGLLGHE
jgi:hypothetical protein